MPTQGIIFTTDKPIYKGQPNALIAQAQYGQTMGVWHNTIGIDKRILYFSMLRLYASFVNIPIAFCQDCNSRESARINMPAHPFLITIAATPHTDSVVFTDLPDTQSAPMQGLLVALGQCTILTFHNICQRQRQSVLQYRCTLTAQQRDQHPQIFASITMHISVIGYTLDPKRMAQAWHLVPNYCPIHATVALSCPISHHITIEEAV